MTKLRLRLKNKLTGKRVAILAAVLFAEAFVSPLKNILAGGAWPSEIQVADALTTAILQVCTLILALLTRESAEVPAQPSG